MHLQIIRKIDGTELDEQENLEIK